MTNARKAREAEIIKIVFVLSVLWVLISEFFIRLLKIYSIGADTNSQILVTVTVFFVNFLLLFLGRDFLLSQLLQFPVLVNESDKVLCDRWSITIKYESQQQPGQEVERYGSLIIKNTITGLQIVGRQLFDKRTNEPVVYDWESVFVEVIATREGKIMLYAYKIFRESGDRGVDKVGYVVLYSNDRKGKRFEGHFFDVDADPNSQEQLRSGRVIFNQDKIN